MESSLLLKCSIEFPRHRRTGGRLERFLREFSLLLQPNLLSCFDEMQKEKWKSRYLQRIMGKDDAAWRAGGRSQCGREVVRAFFL